MSLVPEKHTSVNRRSLEVTRTYLRSGQSVARSLWIRVSPKHPLLKAAVAAPMTALLLTILVLVLITLGFALLAIALMAAISRGRERGTAGLERGHRCQK